VHQAGSFKTNTTTRYALCWSFEAQPEAAKDVAGHLLSLPFTSYKMTHPFCAFFFFLFCFGGWRTTLMAASNTALMFWRCKAAAVSKHAQQLSSMMHLLQGKKRTALLVGFLNCIRCRQLHQLASSALHPA